jgi:hypothetical protein
VPPIQSLSEFCSKLPKLRMCIRFPSPAPELLLTQLALLGHSAIVHGNAHDFKIVLIWFEGFV